VDAGARPGVSVGRRAGQHSTPVLGGAATVGSTLTSTGRRLDRHGAHRLHAAVAGCTSPAPTTCAAITGARAATYGLTAADAGRYLRMRVTASNGKGSAAAQSGPTTIVSSPNGKPVIVTPPAIAGAARVGTSAPLAAR
jgi:hypothetical protein